MCRSGRLRVCCNAKTCRHTTCGVSAGEAPCSVVSCRYVPAGDAAKVQGRLGGVEPATRPQRAAPGHRRVDGEGDPQLRARRDRRPRRPDPSGVVDLAVPRPGAGCDGSRARRWRGGDPRLPPRRRRLDAGPVVATAGHLGGGPPRRRGPAPGRRHSGAGAVHPRRPARTRTRLEARRAVRSRSGSRSSR
jgi:hypothetical protein